MTLRIANIIEEARVGGPQIRMVRVAERLSAYTRIIMPTADSARFRALCEEANIEYTAMPLSRITRNWRKALAYIVFSPVEVVRLTRLLKRERIDLVHVSGGSWQYKGILAGRLAGIPTVWHLNDTSMPGWVRGLFKLVQPLAGGFAFASYRSRSYYGDLITGDRPEGILPSAVDRSHFSPEAMPAPASTTTDPLIGVVANVTPVKGHETLLRAAAILRRRYPGLRVEIAGDRPDSQRAYVAMLDALVEELALDVTWLGPLDDVRPLLARVDVYVCSSNAESSPIAVWEAMAMARPVVSTDVGDVSKHVLDGQNGFIVPVGDAEAMADRVDGLLADPAQRAAMGQAAREATLDFEPDEIASRTLRLYEQVLEYSGTGVHPRDRPEHPKGLQ